MIKSGSVISRNENIPTINLDGELAMMNSEKGKYYGMDLVATRIWVMIKEPKRFRSIIETLLHEYNVSKEECEKDVTDFLGKLCDEGLITIQ